MKKARKENYGMKKQRENKKEKKYTGIFQKYMRSFPQLVLSNIMFAIPMAISFVIVWLLNNSIGSVGFMEVFVKFLPVFLLMPFYCGLCKVTKDVFVGKDIRGVKDFFKGVKSNLKFSILHGLIFYIVALIDYFALLFYYQAGGYNSMMYIVFALCIAVTVLTVFCFFLVPLITVTLDIKFKYIYKNAALMSIGELPKNLFALLVCVASIAISTTLFAFTGSYEGAVVVILLLLIFILPVTVVYFINGILYPSIDKLLVVEGAEKEKAPVDKTQQQRILKEHFEENPIDPSVLEGDENELVFYDGKMIKRSKLIEIYKSIEE